MQKALALVLFFCLVPACGGQAFDDCPTNVNDPAPCCPRTRACNAGAAFSCRADGTWLQTSGCWAGTCVDGVCVLPDGATEP